MTYSDQTMQAEGAGCGAILRQAREAAGLSLEQVASQLHMTVRAVANLEADDWTSLGAPVFARGQLRSYARLLGVDIEPQLERSAAAVIAPSTIVSHTHTPSYRRIAENVGRRAIYVAITVAIAVPVWFGMRPHIARQELAVESLDAPAVELPAARTTVQPPQRKPVVASIASLPAEEPASLISIRFHGDSWMEVFDPQGRQVEQGLLGEGDQRSYAPGEVGRIVLGNVGAVDVLKQGGEVDLAPFTRANVARFTLSSDGSLAPVAD